MPNENPRGRFGCPQVGIDRYAKVNSPRGIRFAVAGPIPWFRHRASNSNEMPGGVGRDGSGHLYIVRNVASVAGLAPKTSPDRILLIPPCASHSMLWPRSKHEDEKMTYDARAFIVMTNVYLRKRMPGIRLARITIMIQCLPRISIPTCNAPALPLFSKVTSFWSEFR